MITLQPTNFLDRPTMGAFDTPARCVWGDWTARLQSRTPRLSRKDQNRKIVLHPKTLPRHYAGDVDLFSEGFMSAEQAAKHLQVHKATLYRAMQRGELPFIKMGSKKSNMCRIPIRALRIWTEKY